MLDEKIFLKCSQCKEYLIDNQFYIIKRGRSHNANADGKFLETENDIEIEDDNFNTKFETWICRDCVEKQNFKSPIFC